MPRLRYNNTLGALGASLTSGGTTITFASAPSFPTLAGGDYIALVLDPPSGSTPNANFEIVYLTAYTAGATTGTILRGREGTTAVSHANAAVWVCGPTTADIGPSFRYEGVVATGGSASASSITLTLTQAVAEGYTLIVGWGTNQSPSLSSVSDSQGNTWSAVVASAGAGGTKNAGLISCYVTKPLNQGDTITLNFSATAQFSAAALAFFGRHSTRASNSGATSFTTAFTINLTGLTASDLYVGVAAGNASLTVPSGFTVVETAASFGGGQAIYMGYGLAQNGVTPSYGLSGGGGAAVGVALAGFF